MKEASSIRTYLTNEDGTIVYGHVDFRPENFPKGLIKWHERHFVFSKLQSGAAYYIETGLIILMSDEVIRSN